MKKQIPAALAAALCLTLALSVILPGAVRAAQLIHVVRVDPAPNGLYDAAWEQAIESIIPLTGTGAFTGDRKVITVRAVHDGDYIHLIFRWADDTWSMTKGSWKFDGRRWRHLKGNEDRLAVLFEITGIDLFAAKGCAVVCHGPVTGKRGRFGTTDDSQKGDLWHWKAARSDPQGFADDTWLTTIGSKKGGRRNDSGVGGDVKNKSADGKTPRFKPANGRRLSPHGVMLAQEVAGINDPYTFRKGSRLTYRLPRKPEGSRADIQALSRHARGEWTVMLSRRLNTGHADDARLAPGGQYAMALAVFDDSGNADSLNSGPLTLLLD